MQLGCSHFLCNHGGSIGRLVTLAIEEGMLYVFIEQMQLPNMTVKCCSQFIVVALNYVFSKLIIFRNQGGITEDLD
jgi:putative flippase GtrA